MEAPPALERKRTREDEDDSFPYPPEREESPEAKRLRQDLLDILDDDDGAVDRNPTVVGELDSVLRSLEEEIGLSASPAPLGDGEDEQVSSAQAWLPEADDGFSRQELQQRSELGFLLEASDDELGLPPSTSEEEGLQQQQQLLEDETTSVFLPPAVADGVAEFGNQIWGFDDDMPGPYEGFGFGYPAALGGDDGSIHGGYASGDAAAASDPGAVAAADLEGALFDGDFSDAGAPSDLLWRQETLPAF